MARSTMWRWSFAQGMLSIDMAMVDAIRPHGEQATRQRTLRKVAVIY